MELCYWPRDVCVGSSSAIYTSLPNMTLYSYMQILHQQLISVKCSPVKRFASLHSFTCFPCPFSKN